MATKAPHQPTSQDYEDLGRLMERFLVADYGQILGAQHRHLRRAMLQGFLVGLVSVIGATLGVALLIYILSQFRQIPGLGHVVQSVTQTIQSHNAIH